VQQYPLGDSPSEEGDKDGPLSTKTSPHGDPNKPYGAYHHPLGDKPSEEGDKDDPLSTKTSPHGDSSNPYGA